MQSALSMLASLCTRRKALEGELGVPRLEALAAVLAAAMAPPRELGEDPSVEPGILARCGTCSACH